MTKKSHQIDKLTRNVVKRKFINNGYGTVFDGAGSSDFCNESVRNVVINQHIHKNNFLVLGEGPANDINDSVRKKVLY